MEWNGFYNSYSRMTDVDLRGAVISLDDIGSGEEVTDVLTDISNAEIRLRLFDKAVELGASEIIPFESSRCIKKPKPEKADRDLARLSKIAEEAANLAIPEQKFVLYNVTDSGSTDMGDLSCVMPIVHPYAGGATGTSHGNDYEISDPELACVASAKWQLAMLLLLLSDNARRAKEVIAEFKPLFSSKEEYFKYIDAFTSSGDRIAYADDETATVKIN